MAVKLSFDEHKWLLQCYWKVENVVEVQRRWRFEYGRTLIFTGIVRAPYDHVYKTRATSCIKIEVARFRSTQEYFQRLREALGNTELHH